MTSISLQKCLFEDLLEAVEDKRTISEWQVRGSVYEERITGCKQLEQEHIMDWDW